MCYFLPSNFFFLEPFSCRKFSKMVILKQHKKKKEKSILGLISISNVRSQMNFVPIGRLRTTKQNHRHILKASLRDILKLDYVCESIFPGYLSKSTSSNSLNHIKMIRIIFELSKLNKYHF